MYSLLLTICIASVGCIGLEDTDTTKTYPTYEACVERGDYVAEVIREKWSEQMLVSADEITHSIKCTIKGGVKA